MVTKIRDPLPSTDNRKPTTYTITFNWCRTSNEMRTGEEESERWKTKHPGTGTLKLGKSPAVKMNTHKHNP